MDSKKKFIHILFKYKIISNFVNNEKNNFYLLHQNYYVKIIN